MLILVLGACAAPPEADHSAAEDEPAHVEGLVELTPEKRAAIEITTAEASLRRLSPQLETTGEVGYEQDRLAHVSPRISGRVIRVPASLGDEVAEGRTLAVIDSIELGQAKARFLSSRSRESVNRESYERELALYEDRISSQKEMLDAKADFLEAEAERESAQETLRLYGISPEQIRSLRSGEPGASTLPVRAPIAGRVVEKHVTVGELVTPSESLFTIADLGHVWIWIDVFERDLAKVHEGDDVQVRVDAFPDRDFVGEVTYLSSEVALETRAVRARIDVANSDRLLRPGMFATVRLTDPHASEGAESLVVPTSSVVRSGELEIVFLPVAEGRFQAQPVETGRREGEWVEVVSGLAPGDEIVTKGSFLLKSELAREELGGGHGH
jgi:cobalt-zinc-cadmium efflux system membrane fusion protein